MTKGKLMSMFDSNSGMGNISIKTAIRLLNEFFDSNICIPKGDNRQQYADEIHAYAEGNNDVLVTGNYMGIGYMGCPIKNTMIHEQLKVFHLAIKPSDPIYEWQWKYRLTNNHTEWIGYTKHYTDEEVKKNTNWHRNCYYEKDEATKRERK